MRYAIVGSGGIGAYYGAQLARIGKEVHFLFHSDYQYVVEHGLQVNSYEGSFHLEKINAYHDTADMPKADCVIVAIKTVKEEILKNLLPPLLSKDTLVLLIQNGIGMEADVQRMFPETALAAGIAFICTAKTKPGVVDHLDLGRITIGNYSCKDHKVAELVKDFTEAGLKANEADYLEARWKKAVWNMPFNGMTVALNTQTDKLVAFKPTEKLIYEQMREVIETARILGVKNIDMGYADQIIASTRKMTPYSPSMKLDYDFHRPMEIDYLYTHPIAEARAAGYEMKRLEMLEAELRFKEKEYISNNK